MCTQQYHDELKTAWARFEEATLPGFIQNTDGLVWETRHCRLCHSSLAHPLDLARYGIASAAAETEAHGASWSR